MNKTDKQSITVKRLNELKGGDSQETFAEKIHSSQPNVSKIFNGQPLSAASLLAISKAYHVTTDWLLGLSDEKTTEHRIDSSKLTYADVIAVLDEMYRRGTIHVGSDYNGNYADPSDIQVDDKVLIYLLNARNQMNGAGQEMLDIWRDKAMKDMGGSPVMQCDEDVLNYLGKDADNIQSNAQAAELVEAANEYVKNGRPAPSAPARSFNQGSDGFMNIPDDIDEELPFK